MFQTKITEILTDVPISHQLTEINRQFSYPLIGELTDFFFKNKKIAKIIFKIFSIFFFEN